MDARPARPRKVLITNAVIFKVFIINNLAEQTFSCPFTGTHVLRVTAFFRRFAAAAGSFRLSKSGCRFACYFYCSAECQEKIPVVRNSCPRAWAQIPKI